MTTSSPRTLFPAGSAADRLARISRLILLARASITIERVLPALWPALGFAALYLSAALFGLFLFVPWILQAVLLAATVADARAAAKSFLGTKSGTAGEAVNTSAITSLLGQG